MHGDIAVELGSLGQAELMLYAIFSITKQAHQ